MIQKILAKKKIIMIALAIIISIIIILVWLYKTEDSIFLKKKHSARSYKKIPAKKIKPGKSRQSFTYHMWIYIGDWFYRYGKMKSILNKGLRAKKTDSKKYLLTKLKSCPAIYLDNKLNNLLISIQEEENVVQVFKIYKI